MRLLFTIPVQPNAAAVSAARRRITALVSRRWQLPLSDEALDNVALCASEIIANAMRHTGGSSTVRAYWTGTHLRIEVIDSAPGTLADPCPADPNAENGRGLILVQLIAANWGTKPTPGGKTVWFEIPADTRAPGQRPSGRSHPLCRSDHLAGPGRDHRHGAGDASAPLTASATDSPATTVTRGHLHEGEHKMTSSTVWGTTRMGAFADQEPVPATTRVLDPETQTVIEIDGDGRRVEMGAHGTSTNSSTPTTTGGSDGNSSNSDSDSVPCNDQDQG